MIGREFLTETVRGGDIREGDEILLPGSQTPRLVFAVMDYGERCHAQYHISVRYLSGEPQQGLWLTRGETVRKVYRQETLSGCDPTSEV